MNEDLNQNKEGKILIGWTFPEFKKYERGIVWYVVSVVIALSLVYYAFATGSVLFIFIIIMVMIISLMHSVKEPIDIEFKITERGLKAGSKFFPYEDLKNFWIVYNPSEVKKLFIDFKSGLRPHLTIELEKENPVKIRKILLEYLPEDLERENEPFSEELSRWLKL